MRATGYEQAFRINWLKEESHRTTEKIEAEMLS